MSLKINKKGEKGSTIVEAIVVILILSLGLIPTLLVILLASNLSSTISNNLIAANLAQEGIEVVRAIRDANWLAAVPQPFDTGLSNGSYIVAWNSTNLSNFTGTAPVLRIDSSGLYNYSTGVDSSFTRIITVTKIGASDLRIVSEVSWLQRGVIKKVAIEAHLFDWR